MTSRTTESREGVRAGQLAQLERLLKAAWAGNPFYREKLRRAGLDGRLTGLDEFFARMPFTSKQELVEDQQQHPPFGTNLTYPLEAYTRFYQTSATSGRPMRWLDTTESWQWMLDNWKEVLLAAGGGPADVAYFAFSFGPFLGFWTAFDAAAQLGCLCIPGGGLGSLARLEAMRDNRATLLFCTPTYAMRLAEVAHENGFDLGTLQIRKIIVAGEPGGSVPSLRRSIASRWPKAALFDHHGMTEVGPVSYECPEKPCTLLVIDRSYLVEIVDPATARPVAAGEVGELVLTTLGRLGSPLVRYRTGDLVRQDIEIPEKYAAGHTALRGGILGRTDDMAIIRGVNVYPSAVDEVIRSFAEVVEYRVEILSENSLAEMRVVVEPLPGTADADRLVQKIRDKIRSVFSLRVSVERCGPNELPRFEAKARRWVRVGGPGAGD